jgi:3-deoxy-D-manno-octulosonate 8-phosphate phosphatase KdsC-like HAD superfamily phosphatase
VKAACALTLTRSGGAGAVREFAELLMKARGDWGAITGQYVAERSLPLAELDR